MWVVGAPRGTRLAEFDVLSILLNVPFIADKIRNYRFLRSDFRFTLRLSGNQFTYGRLTAVWSPVRYPATLAAGDGTQLAYGPAFAALGAGDDTPLVLDQGYAWPFPTIDLRTITNGALGYVTVFVDEPLTSISSAASTSPTPVSVYMQFVSPVLGGLYQ